MTLSHILTLGAFGESFSDPKLAKRLSRCLLAPYLPPINPIKYLREQNVLIAEQQAKTKPRAEKEDSETALEGQISLDEEDRKGSLHK